MVDDNLHGAQSIIHRKPDVSIQTKCRSGSAKSDSQTSRYFNKHSAKTNSFNKLNDEVKASVFPFSAIEKWKNEFIPRFSKSNKASIEFIPRFSKLKKVSIEFIPQFSKLKKAPLEFIHGILKLKKAPLDFIFRVSELKFLLSKYNIHYFKLYNRYLNTDKQLLIFLGRPHEHHGALFK